MDLTVYTIFTKSNGKSIVIESKIGKGSFGTMIMKIITLMFINNSIGRNIIHKFSGHNSF